MKQTSIKKMLALFLIAAVMLAAFTACAEKSARHCPIPAARKRRSRSRR